MICLAGLKWDWMEWIFLTDQRFWRFGCRGIVGMCVVLVDFYGIERATSRTSKGSGMHAD